MYLLLHLVAGKLLLTLYRQALQLVVKRFSCETVAVVETCGNKNVKHKSNDV